MSSRGGHDRTPPGPLVGPRSPARLARAAFALLISATLAVAGCGSGDSGQAPSSPGDGDGGFQARAIGSFKEPIYIEGPEGANGLVFVVERSGVIRVVEDDSKLPEPFLDISNVVRSKPGGLLSVAFAPDYAESGLLYVFFTDSDGNSRIQEYRRSAGDPRRADPGSARTVMRIEKPADAEHNGGQLQFGPDGYLYAATGDGGGSGDPDDNAQNPESLLGKLLRIDPEQQGDRPYTVPGDNPFVGENGRDEIYALGLRNPWRFSFDAEDGSLVIGDVGQSSLEEIDYFEAGEGRGANFGWDGFEGSQRYRSQEAGPAPKGAAGPIYEYPHDGGNCSVIGGYVSRDPRIESLYGRYVYADYCKGEIRSLIPATGAARDDRPTGLEAEQINTFGEGADGRIFFASMADEQVYVIDPE